MTTPSGELRPEHPSIVHALLSAAERGAAAASTIILAERATAHHDDEIHWRHDDLLTVASRAAAGLAAGGVRRGDRVLLCLPTSAEFVTAFFGALLLGAVPTAIATPGGFGAADIFLDRFERLLAYLEPTAVVSIPAVATTLPLDGVDLSGWRFLFCGAEPIHPPTVRRFVDRFGAWGLPADALVPCYGLAEASLAVTVSDPRAPIAFDSVSRRELAEDGVAVDVPAGDRDALDIVDCGAPVLGTEVRVVDEHGSPRGADLIGHVQFRGPSTTPGYFRLPEATAASRVDGWWDTGDIGYLRDGRLRITGRRKDLIIIRGANYLPTDFEIAAEQVPGVRPGGVVAVGRTDAGSGSEELHLIVESAEAPAGHGALARAVRAAVGKRTGVLAAGVRIVAPRSIPKTTSGKVQRAAARSLLNDDADELVGAVRGGGGAR
ncbi:AMP-binding protein [Nocardia abscessus]|uniref:AMP-binding protein n=1 Tax=Nocardia abscessus TaxID=120957 RepID=UPI0024556978|nr:AMP-binding protein [Nocardia abscessus]